MLREKNEKQYEYIYLDSTYEDLNSKERNKLQKKLIKKLQNDTITKEEDLQLTNSYHRFAIKMAQNFHSSLKEFFSLSDLVQYGMISVWTRLKKYQPYRLNKDGEKKPILPSTYIGVILRSTYLKLIKHKEARMITGITTKRNNDGDIEFIEANFNPISIHNFVDEENKEYEPPSLEVMDKERQKSEDMIVFEQMRMKLYKSVCKTLKDYRILNMLLDIKKLPKPKTGRNKKCIEIVAEKFDVSPGVVKRIVDRVDPWLKKHDFIPLILSSQIVPPRPFEVFSEKKLTSILHNDVVDIWDIINNN